MEVPGRALDDRPSAKGHSSYQGRNSRSALGDEDTVFFVDNALELLQDFDPSMPYIITGAVLPVAGGCPRVLLESACMQPYLLGRVVHAILLLA